MNIDRLVDFLCVCKYLNFTKAAEELYITTQGLNQSIIRMEQELGTDVFIRTSKGLLLTEDGLLFYECAKKVVNEFAKCRKQMQNKNLIYISIMHHLLSVIS